MLSNHTPSSVMFSDKGRVPVVNTPSGSILVIFTLKSWSNSRSSSFIKLIIKFLATATPTQFIHGPNVIVGIG